MNFTCTQCRNIEKLIFEIVLLEMKNALQIILTTPNHFEITDRRKFSVFCMIYKLL